MTARRPIAFWLFTVAGMVFIMAVIGAVTRLTESGLSIAEWKPLMGAIPPLSDQEWRRVYDLYAQTPEYLAKNSGMSVDEFKTIFWWEWIHRFWGRVIGLAFFLPLVWFWVRKEIPQGHHLKLIGILLLGVSQGAIGWFMVKSGLIDRPSVSHYRLAAHLGLALLIFTVLLWTGLSYWNGARQSASRVLRCHGWISLGFLSLAILWGAFVAGLDAGLVYNTFPLMNGHFAPQENITGPHWLMALENHGWVQFLHRMLAIFSGLLILGFWGHAHYRGQTNGGTHFMAVMVFVQIGLGIATLLTQVSIPLAALHQAGAMTLLGMMVYTLHRMRA